MAKIAGVMNVGCFDNGCGALLVAKTAGVMDVGCFGNGCGALMVAGIASVMTGCCDAALLVSETAGVMTDGCCDDGACVLLVPDISDVVLVLVFCSNLAAINLEDSKVASFCSLTFVLTVFINVLSDFDAFFFLSCAVDFFCF